jgi:tRNA 2-thiouridine synthesizing protein A
MILIDTSGQRGPEPVLALRRALREILPGNRLELLTTDRANMRAVPDFCANSGHRLLMARIEGEKLYFEIEKG